jgi:thioredoxin-like negative regulator of GroEL
MDPNNARVVVVLFTIAGCEACEEYKPRFQRAARQFQQYIPIILLDANDPRNQDFAQRLNVANVPATFVLRRPTGVIRAEGTLPDSQIAWLLGVAAREASMSPNYQRR